MPLLTSFPIKITGIKNLCYSTKQIEEIVEDCSSLLTTLMSLKKDWVRGRRILHIESRALCFVSNSKRFSIAVDGILLQGE